MRIFCAVCHSADPRRFYGGLWSGNFYPALAALGHEVIESKTDLTPGSEAMGVADHFSALQLKVRAKLTEQILAEVPSPLPGSAVVSQ